MELGAVSARRSVGVGLISADCLCLCAVGAGGKPANEPGRETLGRILVESTGKSGGSCGVPRSEPTHVAAFVLVGGRASGLCPSPREAKRSCPGCQSDRTAGSAPACAPRPPFLAFDSPNRHLDSLPADPILSLFHARRRLLAVDPFG